jgi:phosphoglycerate kinase
MNKLSLRDLDVKGKKVIMRVDFNVPFAKDGTISDATRIRAALPSIKYILENGGALILMSHLGRPKGEKKVEFSLKRVADTLHKLLGSPVTFVEDCIGPEVEQKAKDLKSGEVLVLENLRFYKAEEKPDTDPTFAQNLAKLADIYVNDAFGTAHRKHSSTATIASFFPKKAAAGFLMEKEIDFLGGLLENPTHPFYAIIGGSKVSTKMGVLKSLAQKVDGIFIGGGMTFTFLKAKGLSIGNSIHEDDLIEEAKSFEALCKEKNVKLFLPKDLVIADAFKEDANIRTVATHEGIPEGWEGMDIGPETIKEWKDALAGGKTIFWNGPVGVFEMAPFAKGTNALAEKIAQLDATTVVGGGDSLAAINLLGLGSQFTHLSTGGGASLEFIEFGHLPGIDALSST